MLLYQELYHLTIFKLILSDKILKFVNNPKILDLVFL